MIRATAALLMTAIALPAASNAVGEGGFDPIYELLVANCGRCHVQGLADGPFSLTTPPSATHFPECLDEPEAVQVRCATYRQLVDEPAPGIPAWIRPADAPQSEPYQQACDPALSFHVGHSLPEPLPAEDCARFLRWIESGAARR